MTEASRSQRLARWLFDHPRTVALVLVALVVGAAVLLPRLEVDAGVDTLFDKRSQLHAIMDRVDEHFVSDDIVFIAYRADSVFSRRSLEAIRELGRKIERIKVPAAPREAEAGGAAARQIFAFEDVDSLATVDDVVGRNLTFKTTPLVPDPVPRAPAQLAAIRRRARNNPLIVSAFLPPRSDDAATMVVRLARDLGSTQQSAAIEELRQLLEQTRRAGGARAFHLYGEAVVEVDSAAYETEDVAVFIPVVYGLIVLLLFVFVRRFLGIVVSLLHVSIALVAAMAALALIGSSYNAVSGVLPPVIMALAVAMFIHFAAELGKNHLAAGPGAGPRTVARETLAELLTPVTIAAVTTAIGFSSLAVSTIPAVHGFGIASAMAILVALVAGVALAALAWRLWPPSRFVSPGAAAVSPRLERALARLTRLVIRRRWPLLVVALALVAAGVVGITRIRVDMGELEYFYRDTPVRRANDFIESRFGGTTVVVLSIAGDRENRFIAPAELKKLARLARFLRRELEFDHVTSVVDYVKLMHREFLGGATEEHRIPDTEQQVAQLLLLNGDPTLEEYIDKPYRWVRLVGRSKIHNTAALERLFTRIDAYLAAHFPARRYSCHATGQSRLWAAMVQQLTRSQSVSLSISFVAIFAVMFVVFRSLRAGLFSIPPNVFPIVIVLGLMGWAGIWLDAATVMIATVALGIAVDDTVHFMQHFAAVARGGVAVPDALRQTMLKKGPAIIGTSVIIAGGFSVLALSNFPPSRNFGLLVCATMIAALLGDLVFLPALLAAAWRGRR